LHRSVETLLRYLSDRRPKVAGALSAVQITSAQSHKFASLSGISSEELFSQPNAPLTSLTPEQLVRFAQIVDTALFKSYLLIRPGLLGPLCRVANWCEVSEVEEELRGRGVSLPGFSSTLDLLLTPLIRNFPSLSIFTTGKRCTPRRWTSSDSANSLPITFFLANKSLF